jgi:hypothetical protein
MLSNDTQERIQSIQKKVEEVGKTLGIPSNEAAVFVAVDVVQQHARKTEERQSGFIRVWAWFKGWLSHGAETAGKIRIE